MANTLVPRWKRENLARALGQKIQSGRSYDLHTYPRNARDYASLKKLANISPINNGEDEWLKPLRPS